jgi:hypothetical protein
MNCTDAYREALTRQFAAAATSVPDPGPGDPGAPGAGNTLSGDGMPASAAAYVADRDDPFC